MSFLGIIAFVIALLFSVMVHEFGHYLTAKKFHMKVTEFFLGFGKKIWSFQKGETEFGLKAIPAGGYCRIVGMSFTEELSDDDKPRAFYRASATKRLIVLGAGSFLHFVLGFLILAILLGGVGVTAVTNKIGDVVAKSPAATAGLLKGDEITSINGNKVTQWSQAVKAIRTSGGKEITLTILRNGNSQDILVTPEVKVAKDSVTNKDIKIGVIGVMNTLGTKRLGPIATIKNSGTLTWSLMKNSVTSLISLPTKIPALVRQTFGKEKRDSTGLVGVVGVARVSAQNASDPHLKTREKFSTFLIIIASLNIFVGIFNLLPLLPLDGGHMLIAVIDGFRRWKARRKGAAAPAEFDLERLMPLTITVFAILAALSLLLLAADIFHPINLSQ